MSAGLCKQCAAWAQYIGDCTAACDCARKSEPKPVPGSYAQYGEPAGSLMWGMHRAITRLEKERDKLQALVVELENEATNLRFAHDWDSAGQTANALRDARVKAEALRGYAEAADRGVRRSEGDVEWFSLDGRWLREEADRLEAEADVK